MARIRSVHPGLYTDDAFMALSMGARMLLIGIWSHADDGGGFEWKPIVLKARIFPADNLDIAPILEELVENDVIKKYDFEGRSYGAVRNFGKWQRAKKPTRFVPMPEPVRKYCQSESICSDNKEGTSSEPVPNQFGNSSAEGRKVGRYESINVPSERRDDAPSPAPDAQTDIEDFTGPAEILPPQPSAAPDARTALFTAGLKGVRALTGKPDGASRALLGRWLKTAKDDAAVVNSAIRGALDVRPADPVAWIEGAVRSRGSGATRQQAVRDAWAGVPDIEGV